MLHQSLYTFILSVVLLTANCPLLTAHCQLPWHSKERTVHYLPDGTDFVKVNGRMRFNRALYGANTGFRVETGDLPEFALYMPGMGGNFRFALVNGADNKWLTDADSIVTVYRPGSMLYRISDPLLGKGVLYITVLALADAEGMILKLQCDNIPKQVKLLWVYGGATGKRFSRDGDIGADPESSFYLKPEYCKDNFYTVQKNRFNLYYGTGKALTEQEQDAIRKGKQAADINNKLKQITGITPANDIRITDVAQQNGPQAIYQTTYSSTLPQSCAVTGVIAKPGGNYYFLLQNAAQQVPADYKALPELFDKAEAARKKLADRIKVITPDPYINTLGSALAMAADAIWEDPSYLHGAVAWRMRLPAWRGAYAADALGWHDRARKHFSSYALSQVTSPASAPVVMDTALNLARHLEKMGTAMFSSGYICRNPNGDIRPHHYDMNLVFIDQLLNHFYYTGDTAYIRTMWPLIERHLNWEKRNFDADDDGLYDAYCCIWASDALQYSGGGVTHSSAYNYRANKTVAELAALTSIDASPYQKEAGKILQAINSQLWMPHKGWYAEYKDRSGLQAVHPAAGLWTIYHAIDSKVPDPFKAYQSLRYIDHSIPRIPVIANGFDEKELYVLSTTNWQPYTWSVNNVALAENLHTALAYWQGSRPEKAFQLWRSALLESMYLGASPGGFQQLSFYDAIRGQLYRDFADPVGMAGRTLTEGLFGVLPDALHDTLSIQPGFPMSWNYAALETPDINIEFRRDNNTDHYTIQPAFLKAMHLALKVRMPKDDIASITVNGQPAAWHARKDAVGEPLLLITAGKAREYAVVIEWKGNVPELPVCDSLYAAGEQLAINTRQSTILSVYDPQQVLQGEILSNQKLQATITGALGNKTIFLQLQQGNCTWWQPVCFEVVKPVEIITAAEHPANTLSFRVKNHTNAIQGILTITTGKNIFQRKIQLDKDEVSAPITIPAEYLAPGSNRVSVEWGNGYHTTADVINWNITPVAVPVFEKINLAAYYNDKVTSIFQNRYLSPRPTTPTLQLPVQGIGNWCYPLTQAVINDSGLRSNAGSQNEIRMPQGIPLTTPAKAGANNIIFTSQWDNYPDSVTIPLSGNAAHVYLLLAGSTNPMQSRLVNGEIRIQYTDGSAETLQLVNPQNWWPIEQDYYVDGFAFTTGAPRPPRLHLQQGKFATGKESYTTIKGFSNHAIEGGAATVLDMPLDQHKTLQSLTLHAMANDVVIGLMSVTLVK